MYIMCTTALITLKHPDVRGKKAHVNKFRVSMLMLKADVNLAPKYIKNKKK